MARDWQELQQALLDALNSANVSDERLEAFTQEFVALSARNDASRGEGLARARLLPGAQRLIVLATAASFMKSMVWPTAWLPARRDLMLSLDELLLRSDPLRTDAFPRLVLNQEDLALHVIQRATLGHIRATFEAETSKDFLGVLAGTCSRSLFAIGILCGRAFAKIESPQRAVLDARDAYLHAFRNYERAARELNRLANAQIFLYLDQPLGS